MPFYENDRSNGKFRCVCDECGTEFWRLTKQLCKYRQRNSSLVFCSTKCKGTNNNKSKEVSCKQCGAAFMKKAAEITRTPNHFCSHSCAGKYNSTHKTKGTRRSKLEEWLEDQLDMIYPELDIRFNETEAIGSELDIFIPSLNLAFELNGIFHYEPIFGQKKLQSIKENDINKYKSCIENEIDLCIIDTSSQKRFTESSSQKFLDLIVNIINDR